jgi:hypothetical protein
MSDVYVAEASEAQERSHVLNENEQSGQHGLFRTLNPYVATPNVLTGVHVAEKGKKM